MEGGGFSMLIIHKPTPKMEAHLQKQDKMYKIPIGADRRTYWNVEKMREKIKTEGIRVGK